MSSTIRSYAYVHTSAVRVTPAGRSLALETSIGATPDGEAANPRFFNGFLTAPAAAAAALLAVADVAAGGHCRPRPSAFLDLVVTASGDRLRLESFSACCGVHARLDVLAPGLDGDDVGHGTTHVDINRPLRLALARIGGLDPSHLRVGPDGLEATTFDGRFVEKKVPLPERWLRGFAETQVIAAGLVPRRDTRRRGGRRPAVAAAAHPTVQRAHDTLGGSLGPHPASGDQAVARCRGLPGCERLLGLQQVLRHASTVRVYAPEPERSHDEWSWARQDRPAPVAWEAALPGMRLTLLLSPHASRGFSGEDGVLDDLAGGPAARDTAVRIDGAPAWVGKGEHAYLVRFEDGERMSCTCLWWAEYRGGRGPCQHVLATRMVRNTKNNTKKESAR